jgi:hypothetical protein
MTAYRVIEGRDWGMRWARPPIAQTMPVSEVFVHHTAGRDPALSTTGAAAAFKALNEYAIQTKGYSAVDYSMLVHTDKARATTIGEARGQWTPAATLDRNRQSKAVCLFGWFHPPDPAADWTRTSARRPYPNELEAAACSIVWMIERGWVTRTPTILGHRDNPSHPGATSCPGDYLQHALPIIRQHVTRLLTPPAPTPPEEDDMKYLVSDKRQRGALFWPDGMPVSPELRDALVADGFRIVEQDHAEWTSAAKFRYGTEAAYLYGARSMAP